MVHACITVEPFESNCPAANKKAHVRNEAVAGTAAPKLTDDYNGITLKTHPDKVNIAPEANDTTNSHAEVNCEIFENNGIEKSTKTSPSALGSPNAGAKPPKSSDKHGSPFKLTTNVLLPYTSTGAINSVLTCINYTHYYRHEPGIISAPPVTGNSCETAKCKGGETMPACISFTGAITDERTRLGSHPVLVPKRSKKHSVNFESPEILFEKATFDEDKQQKNVKLVKTLRPR